MVVGICDDDIFIGAKAEAMGRIELIFGWSESAEFVAHLHGLRSLGAQSSIVWQS